MRSNATMYIKHDWICVSYYRYYVRTSTLTYSLREQYLDRKTKQWGEANTTATLGEGEDKNATMTVSNFYGSGREKMYTLRYWNNEEKCFVLTLLNINGHTKCELHQWEEKITGNLRHVHDKSPGYHACELEFYVYCPSPDPVKVFLREDCKYINPPIRYGEGSS
uniref:Uncharacterized protein n=1 Tax=Amblyomma parvum TaxID=251391 RepID=A0A023FYP9_AMBPA